MSSYVAFSFSCKKQNRKCMTIYINIHTFLLFQNIDVVCMPKPGDFEHHEKNTFGSSSSASGSGNSGSGNRALGRGSRRGQQRQLGGHDHGDEDKHKCYVTGWGRRSESE